MTTNPGIGLMSHLRRVALLSDSGGMSDGRLLEEFITGRDEAAFEALVKRHGPMVFGVCRRVLGHRQDAEDAFQATFVVLARKAVAIQEREQVGNWLYGVAYRTARDARRLASRRRAKEKQVKDMPHPCVGPEEVWQDLRPVLDEELSRLPDKYRLPVVLCDLEGRTRKEVARQLDVPDGTLSNRLATARRMLAKRLSGRGLALCGATVAALLSKSVASAAVPAALVVSTTKAATSLAAGGAAATGLISVKAAQLAEGVLKTMLLTKLKIATAVLVAVAVLGAGAAALTQRVLADKPADQPVKEKKKPANQPVKEKKEGATRNKVVSGVVKAVDAAKNTLTVARNEAEKIFTVAKDATIVINGKPGNLAALPTGARVTLSRFVDQKMARNIEAVGPEVYGVVKAVDVQKKTFILTVSHGGGVKTFTVAAHATIIIDGKRGQLAGLPTGANVTLSMFVDLRTARTIQAEGPWIGGALVNAVDAEKYTLTVDYGHAPIGGRKTLSVAKDATLVIDGKPGKLPGIPKGARVNLRLSVDQKTARSVQAEGPWIGGALVNAVDAEKNTLTVAYIEGEKTFPVAKDSNILIDGKPDKLAGLVKGANVNLTLSVDQKTIRSLQAIGPQFQGGSVKAVDADKNTVTFDDFGNDKEGVVSGKTFPVAKNADIRIDGKPSKLAALPPGANVTLTLSVDQKTVRSITADGQGFQSALQAVDAAKNTIRFDDDKAPAELAGKTFPVAKDADIVFDGKPSKLAAVPKGASVNVTLSADQKTVRSIKVDGPGFQNVLVTAVDAAKNTITFDKSDKAPAELAGKTFPVAKDATIRIDGKPGKLAGLLAGVNVNVSLSVDQKTVRSITAQGS